MLADVSIGLTPALAHAAPKLCQLNRTLGPKTVVKLLVVVLRAFVDSVRVPDKPDAADLIELADTVAQTYTHDSLKDIILALKEARTQGTRFYQALDPAKIYELLRAYFERKAAYLESQHLDQKAQGASHQSHAVQQLHQLAPQLTQGLGRQIPADHPNAAHLRQRLTIIRHKLKRGLLTAAQAEQLRQETADVTHRHDRPDWQPDEATQQTIRHRHQQATRRFAEAHGINPRYL